MNDIDVGIYTGSAKDTDRLIQDLMKIKLMADSVNDKLEVRININDES